MSRLDDVQLKGVVVALLRANKPMERVNFTVGQFTIGTMMYQILAGYCDLNRLLCVVDASQIPDGAAAVYDPEQNTIYAKDSRLQSNDDKVNLVHEATHAIIDLMGGLNKKLTVSHLETETCAYIAGAMFSLSLTQSQPPATVKMTVSSNDSNIRAAADAVVTTKGLGTGTSNAGSPIIFTATEILPLHTAIKANSLYKNWKSKALADGL